MVLAAAEANGFRARDASAFIERLKSQDLENKATKASATGDAKNLLPATVLRRGLVVFATGFNVVGAYYMVLLTSRAHKTLWTPWPSLAVDDALQAAYFAVVDRMKRVAIAIRVFIVAGVMCSFLAGIVTSGAPEEFAIALLIRDNVAVCCRGIPVERARLGRLPILRLCPAWRRVCFRGIHSAFGRAGGLGPGYRRCGPVLGTRH